MDDRACVRARLCTSHVGIHKHTHARAPRAYTILLYKLVMCVRVSATDDVVGMDDDCGTAKEYTLWLWCIPWWWWRPRPVLPRDTVVHVNVRAAGWRTFSNRLGRSGFVVFVVRFNVPLVSWLSDCSRWPAYDRNIIIYAYDYYYILF